MNLKNIAGKRFATRDVTVLSITLMWKTAMKGLLFQDASVNWRKMNSAIKGMVRFTGSR